MSTSKSFIFHKSNFKSLSKFQHRDKPSLNSITKYTCVDLAQGCNHMFECLYNVTRTVQHYFELWSDCTGASALSCSKGYRKSHTFFSLSYFNCTALELNDDRIVTLHWKTSLLVIADFMNNLVICYKSQPEGINSCFCDFVKSVLTGFVSIRLFLMCCYSVIRKFSKVVSERDSKYRSKSEETFQQQKATIQPQEGLLYRQEPSFCPVEADLSSINLDLKEDCVKEENRDDWSFLFPCGPLCALWHGRIQDDFNDDISLAQEPSSHEGKTVFTHINEEGVKEVDLLRKCFLNRIFIDFLPSLKVMPETNVHFSDESFNDIPKTRENESMSSKNSIQVIHALCIAKNESLRYPNHVKPTDVSLLAKVHKNPWKEKVKKSRRKKSKQLMKRKSKLFCLVKLDARTLFPVNTHTPDTEMEQKAFNIVRPNIDNNYVKLKLPQFIELDLKDDICLPPWHRVVQVFTNERHDGLPQPQEGQSNQSKQPAQSPMLNYEMFRLQSFRQSEFPPDANVWVTQLASRGFFFDQEHRRARCCVCGVEHPVFLVPFPDGHRPGCTWVEDNRPFNQGTRGVPSHLMEQHFRQFGSLSGSHPLASVFNPSTDSGFQSGQGASVNPPLSQDSEAFPQSGYGEIDPLKLPTAHSSNSLPEVKASTNSLDSNYIFTEPRSLPTHLEVIGVYAEETQDAGAASVLTSATSTGPVRCNGPALPGDSQASSTVLGGALGGADPPQLELGSASYPQFASAFARRDTFSNWSPDHPQRPENLVEAGFFYAGYADCVRCFYCGLGLKYWRYTDIPSYQHARFRPLCAYNRMYRGQEYIDRVQQDVRNMEIPPSQQDPQPPEPPANDHMSSEAALQALRGGWTQDQVQQGVESLVSELGVSCLTYDILLDVLSNLNAPEDHEEGGLEEFDQASSGEENARVDSGHPSPMGSLDSRLLDSVEPHVRNSPPNTTGITQSVSLTSPGDTHGSVVTRAFTVAQASVTGPSSSVQAAKPMSIEVADEVSQSPHTADGGAGATSSRELSGVELELVEREHQHLEERVKCMICGNRRISCVYLPCGHVIACHPCADAASECALCHKSIAAIANVYMA